MTPARVLLADDHAQVRAGIGKLLALIPAITLTGEAGDGRALLEMALRLRPDLVLMDIAMPGLNGLDATASLRASLPATRVLMLSMHQDEAYVRQALLRGADGYLLKDAAPLELEAAIVAVLAGRPYLSLGVSQAPLALLAQLLRQREQAWPAAGR